MRVGRPTSAPRARPSGDVWPYYICSRPSRSRNCNLYASTCIVHALCANAICKVQYMHYTCIYAPPTFSAEKNAASFFCPSGIGQRTGHSAANLRRRGRNTGTSSRNASPSDPARTPIHSIASWVRTLTVAALLGHRQEMRARVARPGPARPSPARSPGSAPGESGRGAGKQLIRSVPAVGTGST